MERILGAFFLTLMVVGLACFLGGIGYSVWEGIGGLVQRFGWAMAWPVGIFAAIMFGWWLVLRDKF